MANHGAPRCDRARSTAPLSRALGEKIDREAVDSGGRKLLAASIRRGPRFIRSGPGKGGFQPGLVRRGSRFIRSGPRP